MKIKILKTLLLVIVPLFVFFFLFTLTLLSQNSFIKKINADAYEDACTNECINLTGDPDEACYSLCRENYCLNISESNYYGLNPIYTQNPENWCMSVQTPTELCIDKCQIQNSGYEYYGSKCTNSCNDAQGDSLLCESLAPGEGYFNDGSVNIAFCSMLDIEQPVLDAQIDIHFNNTYFEEQEGTQLYIDGDIYSDREIVKVEFLAGNGNFIEECDLNNTLSYDYYFGCSTPSNDYNNPGTYYYKIRLYDVDDNTYDSQTVQVKIYGDSLGLNLSLSYLPEKTFNNDFVVKGLAFHTDGNMISEVNILSEYNEEIPLITNACLPDDGNFDTSSETFTCNLYNLEKETFNFFCIETYDRYDNRVEYCPGVTHDSNIEIDLIGHFPLNDENTTKEMIGYGSLASILNSNGFQSTLGFLDEARTFSESAALYMDDYNEHYSFSKDNSKFLIETYVKIDEVPSNFPLIISKMDTEIVENEDIKPTWEFGLNTNGGIICSIYSEGEPISDMYRVDTESNYTLTLDEWQKIGCSWDATTRELAIYLEDEKVKSEIFDEGIKIKDSKGPLMVGAKYWLIHQDSGNLALSDNFNGSLDEILIYSLKQPEDEEEPPVTEYFSNINAPTVVKNSSNFSLTGIAHYDTEISSIEYRKYSEGLNLEDNWGLCNCTDGDCNSSNENFSCNLSNLENKNGYTYQLRFSYNNFSSYLSSSFWEIIDIIRNDENDLIAWWPFGNTLTLYDYSGNDLNGIITGSNLTSISTLTGSKTNIFNQNTKIEISDPLQKFNLEEIEKELRFEIKIKPYEETSLNRYGFIYKPKQDESGFVWKLDMQGTDVYSYIVAFQNDYTYIDDPAFLLSEEWNTLRLAFSSPDQTFMIKTNNNTPKISPVYNPFNIPSSQEPLFIDANGKFIGEIDDIKVFSTADVKAPQVEFEKIGNLERIETNDIDIDITVTDETGIDNFEYLFLQSDTGADLNSEAWVQILEPTVGNWGEKNLLFNVQKDDLVDGPWNLFVRATDSNGFKHLYENGWYTHVGFPTPSAMPYLHFVIEAMDTTPPYIYAHSIIPNPTVDRSPGVRGYVKDFIQEGVGDHVSNISTIEYKINDGEWIEVPPLDGAYNSPMEEFFFKFENLEPGEYSLKIRAEDSSRNSTDSNETTHTEIFTIYEPEIVPNSSVIEKVEDFTNHTFHDVLFSDGVWGNGILRLRQEIEFEQETEFFTNSNEFGWRYGDNKTTTFEAADGNLWLLTNDNRITYYNIQTGQYQKYPLFAHQNSPIANIKDFTFEGRRYLMIYFNGGESNMVYDINNTPLNINDDLEIVAYKNKTNFNLYNRFELIEFDTRNGKFAYFGILRNDSEEGRGNFLIWIDTKGTIMDLEDDTYVVWNKDDELFYINSTFGYQQEGDFTAAYLDTEENIFYIASYNWSIYQCSDGGTPENKADDSCQRFGFPNGTYGVFSILKDPNDYYWFGGNEGLTRIHRNGTFNISDDQKIQVLKPQDLAYQNVSHIKWVTGEYPVGDEIWMMTRSGYIKALEFNYTYNDTLDDTKYNFKINNIFNRQGGFSQFTMTDRNTIYVSIQGYGLQKISLTRQFANTNRIEMLPIPPNGILSINHIDLEEVLGTVTAGSTRTFNELVSYEVSNDAGVTWYPITLSERVIFPTPDYKLKLRINLNRGSSPIIDLIKLTYVTYPDQDINNQCNIKINSKFPEITSLVKSDTNDLVVNFLKILNEPNIQNYVLEYGLSNSVFQFHSINISPLVSSYTVPNLNLNTEYFFRLKAVTDCTQSNWSSVLSALITPETTVPSITPPTNPLVTTPSKTTKICGETCNIDADCLDQNNICMNGRCQLNSNICLVGETLDENKCSCITETSMGGMCGDSCINNFQCTQNNNKCVDGKCRLMSCPIGSEVGSNGCGCFAIVEDTPSKQGIFEKIVTFFKNISPESAKNITNLSLAGFFASYMLAFLTGGTYPMAYLLQGFTTILGGVRVGKKSQDYGMVYDSITKEPIDRAIIRIFNKDNKLVATEVTNQFGIFEANIQQDSGYRIAVMTRNYNFPSNIIKGLEDGIYQNIYRGENFEYDPSSPINYSIPLDPFEKGSTEYSKAAVLNRLSTLFGNLQNILLILGFVFAIVSYINNNSHLNLAILGIYILIAVITFVKYLKNKKKYGLVIDANNHKKSSITIILKELEFDKIHSQRITDEKGRYRFIVPGGKYRIELANSSYDIMNKRNTDIDSTSEKITVINKNLLIKRRSF